MIWLNILVISLCALSAIGFVHFLLKSYQIRKGCEVLKTDPEANSYETFTNKTIQNRIELVTIDQVYYDPYRDSLLIGRSSDISEGIAYKVLQRFLDEDGSVYCYKSDLVYIGEL